MSYELYGIKIQVEGDTHIAFIGGKKYETKSRGDMVYLIQQLQAGIGVIH